MLGDDSNHASINRIPGEIIVATFSYLHEDHVNREFPTRRNVENSLRWLNNPQRDYRFARLTGKIYRYSAKNLVKTLPNLICSYIEENNTFPKVLGIYMDGKQEVPGADKDYLVNFFRGLGIKKVIVGRFPKARRNGTIIKKPVCPALVYHADGLASWILHLDNQFLVNHKKLVFVD